MTDAAAPAGVAPSPLQLRPRLKPHVDFHRHLYSGEVWYVFHDRALDRFYRVSGPAADLVGAFDGTRTVAEICEDFKSHGGDDAPDPAQAAEFIKQLNGLGLLRTGLTPSAESVERLQDAVRKRQLKATFKSPMSFRIPLFDPTWLLDRLAPVGEVLFSRVGAAIWGFFVLIGTVVGLYHWQTLASDFSDQLLSLSNLGLIALIYPVVKGIHELGHGMALRRYGLEVRRVGVMILVFMPMPYVDASASVVLRNKHERMLVAGAGIMVELFIAALALIGWALSTPGTFHVLCYNTFLIAGLSTIFFNGNPLQRYDGYYLMCDLIEMPSLGMRSQQYISYLFRRYVMATPISAPPVLDERERAWLVGYGVASTIYRLWLVISISIFVARSYPLIGGGLAVWSIGGMLSGPVTGLYKLVTGPVKPSEEKRVALLRLGAVMVTAMLLLFAVPMPLHLVADGVVWLPDEANVRAQASGEIVKVLVKPENGIAAGQPVVLLENVEAQARLKRAQAEIVELEAIRMSQAGRGRINEAGRADDRLVAARERLRVAQSDVENLVVRSPVAGMLLYSDFNGLIGRFLPKGQAVAAVWKGDGVVVRALVPLHEIDRLRSGVRGVDVIPGYDEVTVMSGRIIRVVPSAIDRPPSLVLSTEGGGSVGVVSGSHEGRTREGSLEVISDRPTYLAAPMFEVDVAFDQPLPVAFLNGRASVRFDLGYEPLGPRIARWVRLTFMKELHA